MLTESSLQAHHASLSKAEYGIVTASDVMVPMRDGVRLATDIHRPALDGEPIPRRLPTILGRTSYEKTNKWLWLDTFVTFFVPRGYVVIVQDIRGRHHSEGDEYYHTANPWEGVDGYDTIEWIAAQPWSSGRVGMVGSSHGSIVQQVAALHSPPHLTAIWPDVGPTNIYAHEAREGGAMSLQMFGALFMHAYQDEHASPEARAAIEAAMRGMSDWVFRMPFKPGQTALSRYPCLEKTLFDYYWRGAYDEWWGQECCDQEPYWSRHADIPAVFSGGWIDPFSAGTTKYYATMVAQNKSSQRLIMGPWTHDSMRSGGTVEGDVDFGPDAEWGLSLYNHEQLRWFDKWLKDSETGILDDAPVRLFVMGTGDGTKTRQGHLYHGGYWRSENEWPLTRANNVPYYLRADGSLSDEAPPADVSPVSFEFDPHRPVPTIGGNIASFYELVDLPNLDANRGDYVPWYVRMRNVVPAGFFHQKEGEEVLGARPPYLTLASRSDVTVFQTGELHEAVELTGSCVIRLWVSSSAVDTDITAKLVDVYPPSADYPEGYHLGIVDTILRLRYRNGWEQQELMEPGSVHSAEIVLPPTSNVFKAGHRIRLDISSSNFPRFDVNPNTGEPIGKHTHMVTARNSIYVDSARPSHAVLPVIPLVADDADGN